MTAEHTPGPWLIADNRSLNDALWIYVDHEGLPVSHAEVRSGCDEADELGDVWANARLIAAAPEMYEALAELVLYHDVPAKAQDPVVLPLLRAAFAALRKARGEA